MKKHSLWLSIFLLLLLNACSEPGLSGNMVKKEYFTGGKIRSEFILDDKSGQNGTLKKYGYEGHVSSIATIRNGVPHGYETGYDTKGRMLWKTTYVNGMKEGMQEAYYPNGDVMVSYTYKNGMKNGPAKTFNKDGSVHKRVLFKNDKIVN